MINTPEDMAISQRHQCPSRALTGAVASTSRRCPGRVIAAQRGLRRLGAARSCVVGSQGPGYEPTDHAREGNSGNENRRPADTQLFTCPYGRREEGEEDEESTGGKHPLSRRSIDDGPARVGHQHLRIRPNRDVIVSVQLDRHVASCPLDRAPVTGFEGGRRQPDVGEGSGIVANDHAPIFDRRPSGRPPWDLCSPDVNNRVDLTLQPPPCHPDRPRRNPGSSPVGIADGLRSSCTQALPFLTHGADLRPFPHVQPVR